MHLALRYYKNILGVALIGLFITFGGLYALHHASLNRQPVIANGLLADMLLTFPLAFYFIVIRPLKIKATALLLVFSLCCLVAYLTLPPQQKAYVLQLRKLTVLIELVIVGYAISKTRQIVKVYRAMQAYFPDSAYHLKQSLVSVLGNTRAVKILASELVVLRYSLFAMRKEGVPAQAHQKFTVYRDSGYVALFCIYVFISLVEISGMHLLIAQHHKIAALWVTLFSIYGCFFLVADLSAIIKRPVIITDNNIYLRVGIRWRAVTSADNIEAITIIKNDFPADKSYFKGGVVKSGINVLVAFKEDIRIDRLYQAAINTRNILLSIDNPEQFKSTLLP